VHPTPADGPARDVSGTPAARCPEPAPSGHRRAERIAGALLLRGGPLAGLALLAVVVSAAVLLPAGLWRPSVALPVIAVGLAAAWRAAAGVSAGPVPVRPAAVSLALAAGYALWAVLTRSEHVVLRRDPGSYALYAQWIATRHDLPVTAHLDAFGGAAALDVPGFTLASPAYYQVLHGQGAQVVPQFLPGTPALLSLGWWAGHWQGLLVVPPLVGGLAVLAAAGLAARLVGPNWAPFAAALFAACFPVLHAVRTTYSEGPALVLVLTAAALAVDAARRGDRAQALLAGAVLGCTGLVRVDALTEVALLLPVCTVLVLRRDRVGAPLAAGAVGGIGLSGAVALHLSRPYLDSIRASLLPLVAGTAVLAVACAAAVAVGALRTRRAAGGTVQSGTRTAGGPGPGTGRGVPDPGPPGGRRAVLARRAPDAAFAFVWFLGAALVTRPLWQTVHQSADDPAVPSIAGLQRAYGLEVDGARTYAEHSLYWLGWWAGPIALVAAWAVLAVLARRAVAWAVRPPAGPAGGRPPAWLVPALVGFCSTLLTLYRPGITPDHPWADRRLVTVALPTVLLAATAAAAHLRRARPGRATLAAVVALVVLPLGATAPLALQRTEVGEPGAVADVCDALGPLDVVLAVDAEPGGGPRRAANEWPQVVRGVCDRPAASLTSPAADLPRTAARLAGLIRASGGRTVLLSATPGQEGADSLRALGLDPRRVVSLRTSQDQRSLVLPPTHGSPLTVEVWLAAWDGARDLAASDSRGPRG